MIDSAACCGCHANPTWINGFEIPPILTPHPIDNLRLTPNEQDIIRNLGYAWNLFTQLDHCSDADTKEFVDAIHKAQQLIALRVARRVDPHIWTQP